MKFLVLFAVLACQALAVPMGDAEQCPMEEALLMHLMPIAHKMHMAAQEAKKEKMGDMPELECLIKGKICFGEDSEFMTKIKNAKEQCCCDMTDKEDGNVDVEGEGGAENRGMGGPMDPKVEEFLATLDEQTRDAICKLGQMKMFGEFKMKMDGMKCFLCAMGWINEETMALDRNAVQADLATTLIAGQVANSDATCSAQADALTLECFEECDENVQMRQNKRPRKAKKDGEGCDGEDGEENVQMRQAKRPRKAKKDGEGCDGEDGDMPAEPESRQNKRKNKSKKNKRKSKKGKKNQQEDMEMPELDEEGRAMLLQKVQDMAYLGCVMCQVEETCYGEVVSFVDGAMA